MSGARFTPAPWDVHEWGKDETDIIGAGVRIASVVQWADRERTLADARLIAAAPDLYGALRDLCNAVGSPEHLRSHAAAARAALRKAEGREP